MKLTFPIFLKYKNYNTSQTYAPSSVWWHDKEAFPEGSTYYFKYEKIKWSVLEEKDGKAYLFADLALDAYYYEKCTDNKEDSCQEASDDDGE